MLSLATKPKAIHPPRMAFEDDATGEDERQAKLFGLALKRLRQAAGMSQAKAGEAAGLGGGQSWYKYESGSAPTIFYPDTQRRLTAALNTSVDQLHAARDEILKEQGGTPLRESTVSGMMIRRRVQAGAWLAVEDVDQDAPRTYPAPRDPRFPFADQWLSEVVGDSMDAVPILAGDLVHCVDIVDIGYHPRTGDIVEVERTRFQGREVEVSIKQVEVRGADVLLWPRSTNARWTEPMTLTEGLSEGETPQTEVAIKGLVLSAIRRFHAIT